MKKEWIDYFQDLGTRDVGWIYMATNGSCKGLNVVLDCVATSHMFTNTNYFVSAASSAAIETSSVGADETHPYQLLDEVSLLKSQLQMVFRQLSLKQIIRTCTMPTKRT